LRRSADGKEEQKKEGEKMLELFFIVGAVVATIIGVGFYNYTRGNGFFY
jgi:hypothetical protein